MGRPSSPHTAVPFAWRGRCWPRPHRRAAEPVAVPGCGCAWMGGRGEYWARQFEGFSRLRSRWNSGLESRIEEREACRLLDLASAFLAEVEAESRAVAAAA